MSTSGGNSGNNNVGGSAMGGNSGSSGPGTSNQSHHQHCYEPEPIPAFLVSSAEKDWLTISPYAVKFWDKLNLEPYSKQKNISYIVLVPDFESDIYDNFNYSSLGSKQQPHQSNEETDYLNYFIKNTTSGTSGAKNNRSNKLPSQSISNSINEINQSIKEYFKELTSVYELCRLGLHRPALRIAPDHGFVKVPLLLNNKSATKNAFSHATGKKNPQNLKDTTSVNQQLVVYFVLNLYSVLGIKQI